MLAAEKEIICDSGRIWDYDAEPTAGRVSAVTLDVRFWNRLYCLAFDDVAREICDIEGGADPEVAGARKLTAQLLHCFSGAEAPYPDASLARRFDRLLRGTLFVRFGERVLYWMDRLSEVEDEYQRRVDVLRDRRLTAEDLMPYVDRVE